MRKITTGVAIAIDTVYEAVGYAKRMVDIPVEWEPKTYQDGGVLLHG